MRNNDKTGEWLARQLLQPSTRVSLKDQLNCPQPSFTPSLFDNGHLRSTFHKDALWDETRPAELATPRGLPGVINKYASSTRSKHMMYSPEWSLSPKTTIHTRTILVPDMILSHAKHLTKTATLNVNLGTPKINKTSRKRIPACNHT